MELTHLEVESIAGDINSLGEKKHPLLAYRVSLLNDVFKPVIKALNAARVPEPEFQMFSKRHTELCKTCAKKDITGKPLLERQDIPAQSAWVETYPIADKEAYVKGIKELETEFAEALVVEGVRQEKLVALLQETVDLELKYNIKYSWCKELLSGNSMTRLLECGILVMDEEPEEELDESEGDTSEEVTA